LTPSSNDTAAGWVPRLVLRAAFFDALIGNQDRSHANLPFDASRRDLQLIDHGFAFARENDATHTSILLDWRRSAGLCDLAPPEKEALAPLIAARQLLGLALGAPRSGWPSALIPMLDVRDRTQAVILAYEHGTIQPRAHGTTERA
jgi:hypothetical protein